MKNILTAIFVILSHVSFSQSVVVRTTGSTTPEDMNLFAGRSFRVPSFSDTTTANASMPQLDSAGKLLYTYDVNGLWLRQSNPLRWSQIGSTSNPIRDTVYTKKPIAVYIDSTGHQVIYFLQNGLISGGTLTRAACLQIGVTPAVYGINFKTYSSGAFILNVSPADVSFPREDAVVADTSGNVYILTGTPSSTPLAPPIDPSYQILLGTYSIAANASCVGINTEIVHDENDYPEWAFTTSGTITADSNSTANPYHLTKAIFISTYASGSQLIFTKQNGNDTSQLGEVLNWFPYLNGAFGSNQFQVTIFNGSTQVGNTVSFGVGYGFNPNDSDQYQNISIPFSAFNINSGTIFNKIVIQFAGNDLSGAKGLYKDYIQLQTGASNIPYYSDWTTSISNDSLYQNINGTKTFIGIVGGGGSGGNGLNIYNGDSSLSGNRTVNTNGHQFNVTGTGNQINLKVNTGSNNAQVLLTPSNVSIFGAPTTGSSNYQYSIQVDGTNGVSSITDATIDSGNVSTSLTLQRNFNSGNVTLQPNYGENILFKYPSYTSALVRPTQQANSINSYWTNALTSTRTSALSFTGVNSSSIDTTLILNGNGQAKLNQYTGTNFYGTLAHRLGVDASGNVIQDTTSTSGGSGTVTSIATGYGLSGGPITTIGTIIVDSAALSLKYLRIADTSAMLSPYQQKITLTTTGTSGASTLTGSTLNIPQYSGGGAASNTVTEQKIYYRGEYVAQDSINRANGAIVACDTSIAISGYIHVFGSESVTISVPPNYSNITIYGWTYDTTLTAISEIRSASLIGITANTYTFTTPSNARFMNLYVKFAGLDFAKALSIKSTNTITYNVPVTPEQFSGSKSVPIQSAINFARFTSNGVLLTGSYTIDSTLLLSSGSTLILNNASLTLDSASKTNVIRNEAVADQAHIFARGNVGIKIIGIGNAVIKGSKSGWGGGGATGVGQQLWRPIAIILANVKNFEISGVTITNSNMWAVNLEQSRIGLIKDVTIHGDSSHINQDGINIRWGTNRVTLDNINTENFDDAIALTNLIYQSAQYNTLDTAKYYEPYVYNHDIHDIIIKNIQRDTGYSWGFPDGKGNQFYKNGILLLCEDGLKIHDINIDGIGELPQIQFGFTAIPYYVNTQATVNDMYNISVSNTGKARINFNRPIKNSSFVNISDSINGLPNCIFADSSLHVYRKYFSKSPQYFDSTYNNNFYTDIVNNTGGFGTGLRIKNKVSGLTDLTLLNSYGNASLFRKYGAVGAGNGLDSGLLISDDKNLIFSSGSNNYISFRPGGYLSSNELLNLGINGNVGINGTSSLYKFYINAPTAGSNGANIKNATSTGSATLDITNNTLTGFMRLYGSSFSIANLQNIFTYGSNGDLAIISGAGSSTGSTNKLLIYGGGYASTQERLRVSSNGVAVGTQAEANSVLQTTSFATAITSTPFSLNATSAHHTILVTAIGQSITLPTAIGIAGREYVIKTTSGTDTVKTTSSQTIDGSTTYIIASSNKYVAVQSDGANWQIIANNGLGWLVIFCLLPTMLFKRKGLFDSIEQ